ncbi:serine/threonine-protein kinase [Rhodothermus marinus]|uniref:Serine/threonine protein kinase n=1 Tax=Rhodothermus marinus (strain ATCC 43812 / DSM 4252 / R-10) TaxID=518766 RepID=D0MEV9_RHOM4|nr:serine/threonine-protein kinase [Rhodothermus marinus]ACY47409.1 serine/threonine protein kinase [Rhodothermus marinus DSM 4252]
MGRPERIGDLQPFAELASGPTATVYKAYQASLDRFVLLKILRPELAEDEAFVQRFEEEARLAARVQHPNVVAVYAFGREGPHVYFATEFVEGVSLRELLAHGPLPPALALYIVAEVARGLKAAHEKGVLHRDLKPANILISLEGQVKLTDFGMASLLACGDGEIRGTPGYLAPEQVLGEAPGPATDLFALGATLFEMLTGTPAFPGETPGEIFDAVLHHDPIPRLRNLAAVPDDVVALCARLLAKRPEQRYPDAAALLQDLEELRRRPELHATAEDLAAYVEDPTAFPRTPVPTAQPEPPAPPPARRRRRWLPATAVALLLGLGLLLRERLSVRPEHGSPPSLTASARTTPESESLTTPPEQPPPAAGSFTATDTLASRPQPAASGSTPDRSSEPAQTPAGTSRTPASAAAPPSRTPPRPARLRLEVTPWAYVVLERPDGHDSLGATPLEAPLTLPPGSYTLHMHNPEFPPYRLRLTLRPGQDTLVVVSLWMQVARLWLEVHPWAHVYIDNRYHDVVPPQQRPFILTPGLHRLRLVHPELGARDTLIQLQAGTEQTLRIDLLRRRPPER